MHILSTTGRICGSMLHSKFTTLILRRSGGRLVTETTGPTNPSHAMYPFVYSVRALRMVGTVKATSNRTDFPGCPMFIHAKDTTRLQFRTLGSLRQRLQTTTGHSHELPARIHGKMLKQMKLCM